MEKSEGTRRPLSEWAKLVKIALIQRNWDIGDLAKAIDRSRGYTSAVVNERVRAESVAQSISDVLNISNTAYSNW